MTLKGIRIDFMFIGPSYPAAGSATEVSVVDDEVQKYTKFNIHCFCADEHT